MTHFRGLNRAAHDGIAKQCKVQGSYTSSPMLFHGITVRSWTNTARGRARPAYAMRICFPDYSLGSALPPCAYYSDNCDCE